ncbi:MAG: hypothetical protein A2W27_03510 [Deltaproteobacteria bacterium RBG_16_44_11]|nr:MAG: hypothetical protein A2W27_03510 [Deltaproteobacteria bacterium RBG_16_44_11]
MKKIFIFNLIFISLTSFCFAGEGQQTKVIKMQVGDNFSITLKANSTTGYQWQFAIPLGQNMLQLINSEYIAYKTRRVGAEGKQVWTFKALKAGETNISFKYVRQWEENAPPQKEASFDIVIKQKLR